MFQRSMVFVAVATVCAGAHAQQDSIPSNDQTEPMTPVLVDTTALSTTTTLVAKAPTSLEVRIRSAQKALNQVNKPYANQLGTGNGSGVVVGVVDSGVQRNHPILANSIVAGYNAFTGTTDITDQLGHGTHVSGLIAGNAVPTNGMSEGIAPGAKLAIAKVFSASGSSDVFTIGKGIDWVVNTQRAPIVNLSLGANFAVLAPNIQNAVNKGTLVVAALGNNGFTNAASWPASFARESWAKGQVIAVGAVDANNKRASFSNYDKTLANWTVYAPGVNVLSSYSKPNIQSGYTYMSGTSMATPIVSGQAALIRSNWNFLAAKDIAQVIFQSASRLCSDNATAAVCASRTAPDTVYGWGLVNVGASLQPIGGLNVGTKSGASVAYGGTTVASAKSGIANGMTKISVMAVDKFNRGFLVNVSNSLTSPVTKATTTPTSAPAVASVGAVKFAAEYTNIQTEQVIQGLAFQDGGSVTLGRAYFSFDGGAGFSYGMGTGGTAGKFFGLDATDTSPLSLSGSGEKFSSSYFQLAENSNHFGYGIPFVGGTLRFGVITQSNDTTKAMLGASDLDSGAGAKAMTVAEFQKSFGETVTVVSVGHLIESGAILGASGTGAMALGGNSNTNFVTLAGSRTIAENTTLSAMLSLGKSEDYANSQASLVDGISGVTSAAWSLGLAKNNVWKKGDALGFSISMPLRTMSGSATVTSAVSQNQADGSLNYATQTLDLTPSGSQRNIEMSYAHPVSKTAKVTALAQMKLEPGHVANAPTVYGVGMKFTKSF